ncbi:MAG: hypothetical protein NTW08_04080 [Gammaproteobacteria bacterium]|nr:hypothetical protein [Gammaproteobacteria bacterium]
MPAPTFFKEVDVNTFAQMLLNPDATEVSIAYHARLLTLTDAELLDFQISLDNRCESLRGGLKTLIDEVKPTFGYRDNAAADAGLRAYADGSIEERMRNLAARLASIAQSVPGMPTPPAFTSFDNDKVMKQGVEVGRLYVQMDKQLKNTQYASGVILDRLTPAPAP